MLLVVPAATCLEGEGSKGCRGIPGCTSCTTVDAPRTTAYGPRSQRRLSVCIDCKGPAFVLDEEYSRQCHCAPGHGINPRHKDTKYSRYRTPSTRLPGYSRSYHGGWCLWAVCSTDRQLLRSSGRSQALLCT